MFINLICIAASAMRCGANSFKIFLNSTDIDLPVPHWTTARLWLLKLGHYKLHGQKKQAKDWIWIIDHSIQVGVEKCFVILGIRACKLVEDKPLTLNDVEPIEMIPVKNSNGDVVYEQLKQAANKTGVPRAIVCDQGPDLVNGVKRFCKETNYTDFIYDIKHKTATMLKKHFEPNEAWKSFTELATVSQKYMRQTELAPLIAPNQRSKARYMNLERLIKWGMQIIHLIETKAYEGKIEYSRIKTKLSWVLLYKQELIEWNNILQFALTAEKFIRYKGIYRGVTEHLIKELYTLELLPSSRQFKDELIAYVLAEEGKVRFGERLLASSEVIESLFGCFKRLEKSQSNSGFTKLLLALPAFVGETTRTVVKKAMEFVKVETLHKWFADNVGQSVQAARKEYLGDIHIKSGENLLTTNV